MKIEGDGKVGKDLNGDSGAALRGYPSIFNDVIGPVMRGPSSSHCAAAVRIGRMARELMDGMLEEVTVEFDPNGSLAATHESQGSDMGLFGGLLGWDAADERLAEAPRAIRESGVTVRMGTRDLGAGHPNTYLLTLRNSTERHTMKAVSTGGGMIEIMEIDGVEVSIAGDYHETLIFLDSGGGEVLSFLRGRVEADEILLLGSGEGRLVEIKGQAFVDDRTLSEFSSKFPVRHLKRLSPVLPVRSRKEIKVPFTSAEEMLRYNEGRGLALWELALRYESARGDVSDGQVFQRMKDIVDTMIRSVREGVRGTEYADRILGHQSGRFRARMENGQLLGGGLLDRVILYVTAMMEMKSSMGVIVAAPTAGACGCLPGACIGAAEEMGLSEDEITKAMLSAGMIGVYIAAGAGFAAETGGCQAECGAGSGMAAAALATLAGASASRAVAASSMALQNILGMVCDPVAGRVEVPCLGKNVMAAANAVACADMALSGYDEVIPLDEVIGAMERVGRSIPPELRCTALGGLSITRTARQIERRLNKEPGRA